MTRLATLDRSVRLFRAFLVEQTEPDRFYSELAADSVRLLKAYTPLDGKSMLDVGGGPGYFADAFLAAGAGYIGVEPDAGELSARGGPAAGMVRASALALPFADASFDVCYSSNVLEHVPDPHKMLDEMVRVTRPGGTVFVSFTPWWSPWGGHETAPWHYLGGGYAARRYLRRTGHEPKNRFGHSLYPISINAALKWARRTGQADLVHFLPRYHPWWARWVVRVPVVREVVSWNLAMVLRRR
ncbi:class I SAM-dependent methyltransferase [Virgisporangium ochraceum]